VTYGIVYGLNSLVEDTILYHGDRAIDAAGMHFGAIGVGIYVKSHMPGTGQDITISQTSHILRGLWEILATCGAFTMETQIYIGGLGPAQYRGTAGIFQSRVGNNATQDVFASDTAK